MTAPELPDRIDSGMFPPAQRGTRLRGEPPLDPPEPPDEDRPFRGDCRVCRDRRWYAGMATGWVLVPCPNCCAAEGDVEDAEREAS